MSVQIDVDLGLLKAQQQFLVTSNVADDLGSMHPLLGLENLISTMISHMEDGHTLVIKPVKSSLAVNRPENS